VMNDFVNSKETMKNNAKKNKYPRWELMCLSLNQ